MIYSNPKNGLQIEFPEWEEPTELRWLNGVPFGGARTDAKEVYMEQMMEYDRAIKICDCCGGEGWMEEIDYKKVNSASIDIPYKKVECNNCNGTGRV